MYIFEGFAGVEMRSVGVKVFLFLFFSFFFSSSLQGCGGVSGNVCAGRVP